MRSTSVCLVLLDPQAIKCYVHRLSHQFVVIALTTGALLMQESQKDLQNSGALEKELPLLKSRSNKPELGLLASRHDAFGDRDPIPLGTNLSNCCFYQKRGSTVFGLCQMLC